ncbi:hypothetical protein ABZ650_39580, partial [Streptomyces griseoviridis]
AERHGVPGREQGVPPGLVADQVESLGGGCLPAVRPADLPAVLPADRPADLPADLPADRPADLPAVLPADRPADLPGVRYRRSALVGGCVGRAGTAGA